MFTREQAPSLAAHGIWQQVATEISQTAANGSATAPGLYKKLETASSPANFRPIARSDVQAKKLRGKTEAYYMLKTPDGKYMRLGERDYFLWERLDGQQDLTRLALLYHKEYKSFALERILNLVEKLRQNNFLVQRPTQLYQQLAPVRPPRNYFMWDFPLHGLDKPLSWLYRGPGHWLFTGWFGLISLVLIGLGLLAFWHNVSSGRYYVLSLEHGWLAEIVLLLAAYGLSVFLHEIAHALSVKHFGGEVRSGGFLFYYGMPAFYINTSDIWMYERSARLLTSAAGPYTNFLIGGLCSLVLLVVPTGLAALVLFSVAVFCYLGAIFNLNVLLELDGYYMLMDWLDFPSLRRRAFDFIRHKLIVRLWQRQKFNREDYLLTGFGLLAVVYSGLMLAYLAWSLETQLTGWFSRLLVGQNLVGTLLGGLGSLLLALMLGALVAQLFKALLGWLYTKITSSMLALVLLLNGGLAVWLLSDEKFYGVEASGLALLGGAYSLLQKEKPAYSVLSAGWVVLMLTLLAGCYWLPLLAGLVAFGWLIGSVRLAGYLDLDNLSRTGRGLVGGLVLSSWLVGLLTAIWLTQRGATWLESLVGGLTPAALSLALIPIGLALYRQHRTQFGYAHLQFGLGCAYFGLATFNAGWSGQLNQLIYVMLSWNLLGCSILYRQASRLAYRLPERQTVLADLADLERLQRAAQYLVEMTLELVQATFSPHAARQIANRLNLAAANAGWIIRINASFGVEKPGQPLVSAPELYETGKELAQMLTYLLDLLGQSAGEAYARTMLERGLDALHWEERELTEEYILPHLAGREKINLARRREVEQMLAGLPLFAECSGEQLGNLARACREQKYRAGAVIIREGAAGDIFYLVKSGRVTVWQTGATGQGQVQVNLHTRGGYFGEKALLQAAPRNATCRAETETVVLVWHKADFDRLARRYFELAAGVPTLYRRLALLQKMPLFKEISPPALKEIASHLEALDFAAGALIIQQGAAGDYFYVIEAGEVEILLDTPGSTPRVIERRGGGEFFGEVALLLNTPRTASVQAVTAVQLLGLRRETFLELVGQSSQPRTFERIATRRWLSVQPSLLVSS